MSIYILCLRLTEHNKHEKNIRFLLTNTNAEDGMFCVNRFVYVLIAPLYL